MSDNRKFCTPEFIFKKVIPLPYQVIYLSAVIAAVPAVVLYLLLIRRFFVHGGLAFSFGILVVIMSLIIKALSKTVSIYFDQKSIFISDSKGNFKRYLQKDIAGIYSFDYDLRDKSQVSITIVLNDGKKLHLNDANLFERADKEKALMLKRFLTAAKKRLNLIYVKKNRWRAWQGIGANWYEPLTGEPPKSITKANITLTTYYL